MIREMSVNFPRSITVFSIACQVSYVPNVPQIGYCDSLLLVVVFRF
jgi:hypothetical protein